MPLPRPVSTLLWLPVNVAQAVGTVAWSALLIPIALVAVALAGPAPANWMARRIWGPGLLALAGARLVVVGEPVDPRRAQLFVANHQSWIDIPALFCALPLPLHFLAKRELGAVPLLGSYIRAMGMVFVDRRAPRRASASVEGAAQLLAGGRSVLSFPEGTRSRDGRLGRFKSGGFGAALASGAPVVPVALIGPGAVLPSGGFRVRPGTIEVRVGAPIEVAGCAPDDRAGLARAAEEAVRRLARAPSASTEDRGRAPRSRCARASSIGFAFAAGCVAQLAAAATPPEFAPAVAAAAAGDAARCAALFEQIAGDAVQSGLARRARYGAAVCAVQAGELDRAFAALEAALALDFHDAERFYDDPRLRPLRADRRWPALERKFHEAAERWRAGLHPELLAMAREDRADRSPGPGGIDWQQVAPRDRARGARVRAIVESGVVLGPDDLYHAALVLQHGEGRDDFALAHELAKRAAEGDADHPQARWLAAAALDRSLVADGLPQRYGTQSVRDGGRWVLAPVDPQVTDAERALWDVPPLAESRARVESMNPPPASENPAPEAARPEAPPSEGDAAGGLRPAGGR